MSSNAEALVLLNEHAQGMLTRVYNLKTTFNSDRAPEAMREPALKKMHAAIEKHFPSVPPNFESMPGYDLVDRNAQQYEAELQEYYFVFQECLEFKEVAYKVLADMSTSTRTLDMSINPRQMTEYLDLMVAYAQLQMLVASVAERRIVVGFYARAYFRMKLKEEEHYSGICTYLQEYSEPRERLIEEFASISSLVGSALTTLQMPYMKLLSTAQLRDDGDISIVSHAGAAAVVPANGPIYTAARNMEKYTMWILFGTLLCPNELASANLFGLLKTALSYVSMLPVHRDVLVVIHNEFQQVFASFNGSAINLTKQKKFVVETSTTFTQTAGATHRERRQWLRQALASLYSMCAGEPGLLGPKLPMVLAACALATDEIKFYVHHHGREELPPNKSKAKHNAAEFEDPTVPTIVYYVDAFVDLLEKYEDDILAYHVKYLQTTDVNGLQHALNAFSAECGLDQEPLDVFEDIISACENASAGNRALMETISLNWMRLQVIYCSQQAPFQPTNVAFKNLAARLNLISQHAEVVGNFKSTVLKHASLDMLFWHRPTFLAMFQGAVGSPTPLAMHSMAMAKVCDTFAYRTSRFLPEERVHIGSQGIELATQVFSAMAKQITNMCQRVGESILSLKSQLAPVEAFKLFQAQRDAAAAGTAVNPSAGGALPGTESIPANRNAVARMSEALVILRYLCMAFGEHEAVRVFDSVIVPREILVRAIKDVFSALVLKLCRSESGMIARPSQLLSRLQAYLHGFSLVERYIDVNVQELIRTVMVHHSFSTTLEQQKSGVEAEPQAMVMVDFVAKWYTEFVLRKVVDGVCFSPLNGSFITPPVAGRTGPFAQHFLSEPEIRALVTLLGPYGVDVMDHHLVNGIGRHIVLMKKILAANRSYTEELVTNYHAEDPAAETIAKFQSLPQLTSSVVAIGNITFLRNMLRKALREAVRDATPFIASVVESTVRQYAINYEREPKLLGMDQLAKYCGSDRDPDHLLLGVCAQVTKVQEDVQLWARLPFVLAACFSCTAVWGQPSARYDPDLEAAPLGGHAFAQAAALLISAFTITLEAMRDLRPGSITRGAVVSSRLFVEVSSVIILRLFKVEGKAANPQIPSLLVALDKFVQASEFISQETADVFVPYAATRSAYRTLYQPPEEPPKRINFEITGDVPVDLDAI
ncbi:uncharacterized protein AMSG_00835 [Thecamonas trahens ATCC 50062]|uniref:Uncharacterized protein n=1 Tax=Thecamonas trahens ATCC 50062 TaxID=461836 RepID=A0A0L0DEM9_THETB|nr:hypothetical protein AMSG_00835 [Thecamonas trahens ATCC 50062]KNC50675.1 hypothetical protein AMSG_00835 [Thecamonas trahens ATCC 50062]|eukprot:XP_013762555.1 hypothetical protein AMSG_00835 [Thecamonas trahens ATCC 50062]